MIERSAISERFRELCLCFEIFFLFDRSTFSIGGDFQIGVAQIKRR